MTTFSGYSITNVFLGLKHVDVGGKETISIRDHLIIIFLEVPLRVESFGDGLYHEKRVKDESMKIHPS